MKTLSVILVLLCIALFAGCGNVYLQGDAMTAAQTSALDAFDFNSRVQADPNASALAKAYAPENYTQWRSFVRSARNDANWGPKLPAEANQ